jgi:hypothetical protein
MPKLLTLSIVLLTTSISVSARHIQCSITSEEMPETQGTLETDQSPKVVAERC